MNNYPSIRLLLIFNAKGVSVAIDQRFIDAVVEIVSWNKSNQAKQGTGFIIRKNLTKTIYIDFLVTNNHVIQDMDSITIGFRGKTPLGNLALRSDPLQLVEDNGDSRALAHTDSDVAIVPLQTPYKDSLSVIDLDKDTIDYSSFAHYGYGLGDTAFLLGYPLYIVKDYSMENKAHVTGEPICRKGCIARLSDSDSPRAFLLDIQSYQGNSGGPALAILPDPVSGRKRTVLIGITFGVYCKSSNVKGFDSNKNVVDIPARELGLATVLPVECIKEIIDGLISRQMNLRSE